MKLCLPSEKVVRGHGHQGQGQVLRSRSQVNVTISRKVRGKGHQGQGERSMPKIKVIGQHQKIKVTVRQWSTRSPMSPRTETKLSDRASSTIDFTDAQIYLCVTQSI